MQNEIRSQITVKTALENGIGHLIFSNPAKRNALDQNAWLAIPPAVDDLVARDARVLIVRGDGNNFSAGADISEFDVVRKDAKTARIYEKANADAFAAIRRAAIPTIAHIDGFCLGGGFGLAAACDLRFATHDASFAVPAARIGLAYPVDAMADIVEAVGAQGAKKLLFTAERLGAADMVNNGFLCEPPYDPEELRQRVSSVAASIAALAPLTHRATKAAVDAALNRNVTKAEAAALGDQTFESEDYIEGRNAFREKRNPNFRNK